jgi:FtsP/CotA-like multicopper oxidase with cupredoxin domain
MTGDTHPMHVHLVTFQVVGRTPFDVSAYQKKYGTPNRKIPTDLSLAGGSGSSGDCRAGGGQAASVRVTV